MGKLTLDEKLHKRNLSKPNGLMYAILMVVIKILNITDKPHFTYKAEPSKDKNPYVLISNHASRVEYQFMAPPCYPEKLNFVVGYNEFFRFPLNLILKPMQVIPKKNFTPDFYCIKQINRIIKEGGHIAILPEGMSSITGMAQPVMTGSAKLLKSLGVTVYYTKIAGAYLTYTKHCLDHRPGRIEVVVDKMFSPEELKSLSVEEIEDRMNRLLAHDDYVWNKKAQVSFNGKGEMAKDLDTLLYMCPKCGAMHKMECKGNIITCKACGNAVELDEAYNLKGVSEGATVPKLVTDWVLLERQQAMKDVREPDFKYSEHVQIARLPKYKLLKHEDTSQITGDGILTLDKEGLHFTGKEEGRDWTFFIPILNLPTFGMCTDITRFYTFVDGEFIEFFPDSRDVLRWDHLTEEMHRAQGGKWQNTKYRHYDSFNQGNACEI